MRIVFDLDNTLTDSLGSKPRPGIDSLLQELCANGNYLVLWTNSEKKRAQSILSHHNLNKYFHKIIAREEYYVDGKETRKDCRMVSATCFIDDDPKEVKFNLSNGIKSYRLPPYTGKPLPEDDIDKIKKFIYSNRSILSKIFGIRR